MSKKIEKIAKLIGTLNNDDLNKIVEVVKHHRKTLALSTKLNLGVKANLVILDHNLTRLKNLLILLQYITTTTQF